MNTFGRVAADVSDLERIYFERLASGLQWTDALRACITGAVQFAAIDPFHREQRSSLPVICTVGINYTQGGVQSTGGLIRYHARGKAPSVERATSSRPAVALAIAAYNRNTAAWSNPGVGQTPASPLGAYGSASATKDSGLLSHDASDLKGRFILVMTNLCPYITLSEWQKQTKRTPVECQTIVNQWPRDEYMDDLYRRIGPSVDLWIGHSAIYGTKWVWPSFSAFVIRNKVKNWLLTPNISPRAHLYLDGAFRDKQNPLYSLFGPERS